MPNVPKEVIQYLSDNPAEVLRIQEQMVATISTEKWRAEIAAKRAAGGQVECGTYGCKTLKNIMDVMCELSCRLQ